MPNCTENKEDQGLSEITNDDNYTTLESIFENLSVERECVFADDVTLVEIHDCAKCFGECKTF